MKNFMIEAFSCVSRFLNVCTGHTADLTLSARAYRDRLWIETPINWVFALFGDKDHCRRWWVAEVQRSANNVAIARKLGGFE